MGHYADIYVIKKTRSKQLGLDFLDHFLPKRKESADAYDVPQYGDSTQVIFSKAKEVMSYMEQHLDVYQSIYWNNTDPENPNRHGMLFYTKDGYMIFGISRDSNGIDDTQNERECLALMQDFLKTDKGYITYECPPEDNWNDFIKVKSLPF